MAARAKPPYYAVIFTSLRASAASSPEYAATAARMVELAAEQPGYIGVESASSGNEGITVSYWESLEAIKEWKRSTEHLEAQKEGKRAFYEAYRVRVAKVEREYGFGEL